MGSLARLVREWMRKTNTWVQIIIDANSELVSMNDKLERKLQDSYAAPMSLPLQFLKTITHDFSSDLVLGQGGFGVVYKGVLQCGKVIAVKRLFEIKLKEEMFRNEVRYLMKIRHKNVVKFVGYCAESKWEVMEDPSGSGKHIFAEIPKRLLCFQYVPNRSLDNYISDESLGLEWNMRFKIITGVCNGLHFLHDECSIVHLDLKPENILMDSTMTPKIADFGLSRIFGEKQSRVITTNRAGTLGYMAPEYLDQGLISNKADIFSLGVIIIEIITGHRDYPYFHQDNPHGITTSLHQFTEKVLGSWRNKFLSIAMERYHEQVRQCITIALQCVDRNMDKRPSANDIIQILNAVDQMDSNNELQPDTQCKDQLVVLNLTIDHDATPLRQSVNNNMLNKEKNNKVLGNTSFQEVLSPTPLPELASANENVKWEAEASCNPRAASDTNNEEVPPSIKIILKECGEKYMFSLDLSQTKPWIVTGHVKGKFDIFDYYMQKSICQNTRSGIGGANVVKFIERKHWIIFGTSTGYITVYTYGTTVQQITSFRCKGLFPSICSLAIHPIQPYVLSSCRWHVQIWDWDKNWQCIRTFNNGYLSSLYELAFNPNNTNEFASASICEVKIWNLGSLEPNYTLAQHSKKVNCLNFFTHDNQQYLITGSEDNSVKIWDMQKRACVHTLEGFMSPAIFVGLCSRLSVLITCTKDGKILLWSATKFRLMRTLNIGGPGDDYVLACLTGSGRVVMGTKSTLYMVDILDEEPAVGLVGDEEPVASRGTNGNPVRTQIRRSKTFT